MRSIKLFTVATLLLGSTLISASSTASRSILNSKAGPEKCNPYLDFQICDPDTNECITRRFHMARSIHEHDVNVQIKGFLSRGWKIVGGGCE